MTERSVVVRLRASTNEFVAAMSRAGTSVKQLHGELEKATKTEKGRAALNDLAMAAGGAGLALGGAFAVITMSAAKFDKQMSAVSAVTDAGAKDMDRLRTAALEAGKATSFSATEAAKAEEELGKAGISTSDILGGALRGSLSLAAAGTIDLAEAADVAAKTMNVFNLSGKDVGHIADVLAASANKSATDVHEMGEALKMGGLAARNAGLSLEDTVGTLSAFADNALVGSDAGTSMKTMLQMLSNPTDKAAGLMKELGIQTYDTQGNFIGVEKLAGVLQSRLGNLTQEQRNAALATIFGSDATRAATVLYDLGAGGIREYITAVDDQGAASETAAEKTNNLMGDIERLRGSLETFAIEAGSSGSSGLRTLVQAADELVTGLGNIPAPVQSAAVLLAGVGGAALLAAAGVAKIKGASAGALESLASIGPRGEKAAAGLEKAGKMAGRVAIAFAALQVAGAIVNTFIADLNPQIDAAAQGLAEWNKQAELAGESARLFGADTKDLDRSISALAGSGFSQWSDKVSDGLLGIVGMSSPLDDVKERVGAFDQALSKLVTDGNAQRAGEVVEEMAKRANVSVGDLLKVLPAYGAALETTAGEAKKAATAQAATDKTAQDMAASWQGAVTAGKSLIDVFDGLNGGAIGWAQAESTLEAAIDDAEKAIGKKKEGIDAETEAGRRNRAALLDIVAATRDATQAKYDETGSVEAAKVVYDEGRAALIRSATQAGLTKKEAEKLANQWLKMPALVSTGITTPGLDAAIRKVQQYKTVINGIPGQRDTRFRVSGANIQFERYGGVVAAASGFVTNGGVMDKPTVIAGERGTGHELYVPEKGISKERAGMLLSQGMAMHGLTSSAPAIDYDRLGAALARHFAPLARGTTVVGPLSASSTELALLVRHGEKELGRRS